MTTATATALDWKQSLADLGPALSERAAVYDASDTFVDENYAEMRSAGLFSALVPVELGGGGLSYSETCAMIREMGRRCGATALTFSTHQHVVAASLWNYRHGKPGEKLLRAVADQKVLATSGGTDWLSSNGTLEPCEGGYRFNAKKFNVSGSIAADMLITSGQFIDPVRGPQVFHFPVPMSAEGVRIERVWETMGMRGTGSHAVVLENVFVPEEAIALRRPCGDYHPVWNVILTVALPLICSAYMGVADAAADNARKGAARKGDDGFTPLLLGELENERATAEVALESMIANVNDLDVEPNLEHANAALIRKTIVMQAVQRTVDKALEASGGRGYMRTSGLERIFRDAYAGQFHPMQPKKQHRFTGRLAMGLDPVGA